MQAFGSQGYAFTSLSPVVRRVLELLGLVVIGVALIAVSAWVPSALLSVAALGMGCAAIAFAGALSFLTDIGTRQEISGQRHLNDFLERDHAACLLVDHDGAVTFANRAARRSLPISDDTSLATALRGVFANPNAVLHRLQSKALVNGQGQEDVITRNGQIRLSVRPVDDATFSWRIEKVPTSTSSRSGANALNLPMLTVGQSGAVLFMNDACRTFLGERAKNITDIFATETLASRGIYSVGTPDGAKTVQLIETARTSGRNEYVFFESESPSMAFDSTPNTDQESLSDLPIPMLKVGVSGEILATNRRAAQVLETNDAVGKSLSVFLGGLGRDVDDWVGEAARGHGLERSEVLKLRHADIERFFDVTLCPIEGDKGAVLVVMTDATEFKTLELQFVQSQKMQAIGQLAGGVAHDFNNLLTAISGHCDLLLLRHDQADQDYSDLVQIHQNANRAASLVGQLLAFSRKQNLKPEVLDLRDTLSELTHLLNRLVGEKVTLSLSHDPALAPVRADKRQLEQVLMNLVVNSRDAMPDGGEIKIETMLYTTATVTKRDRAEVPAGSYAKIVVTDAGTGIPKDKIGNIFEPFFTTKRTGEGTGLGLSTAYGIVKQTGGFIFVDSVVGSGTEFTLLFPIHENEDLPTALPPLAQPVQKPDSCSGVILLVEDEAPVRAFASRALSMQGFTVLEADCAESALETLEDETLDVDIFVTDVIMPGMDGPTWVREALKKRPDVQVVFVSGYAEDAFKTGDKIIENSVFLPKPFSLTELTSTVQAQTAGQDKAETVH